MKLICTVPRCLEPVYVDEPGHWCQKHKDMWDEYLELERCHRKREKFKWMSKPVKHRLENDN